MYVFDGTDIGQYVPWREIVAFAYARPNQIFDS